MTELSPDTRRLLASLASSHDPPPDAAARVRQRVAVQLAAPAGPARGLAWLGWVGAALAIVALAWWATRGPAAVTRPAPRAAVAVVASAAPIPSPLTAPTPEVTAPTVVPAPAAPRPVAAPHVDRDDLPAELRLIERAQTALTASDPAAAGEALRAHARAFPRGRLAEEREALAVQVLCASGRTDEARRAGALFLARHPGSPQSARVRRTCVAAP